MIVELTRTVHVQNYKIPTFSFGVFIVHSLNTLADALKYDYYAVNIQYLRILLCACVPGTCATSPPWGPRRLSTHAPPSRGK